VDRLIISSATISGGLLWIDTGANVSVAVHTRARRATPSGTQTVLVVLVEGPGPSTTNDNPQLITSDADLATRVFDTSASAFSVTSQYTACSNGVLTLQAGLGTNVGDGVVRVVVATDLQNAGFTTTYNTVKPFVNTRLSVSNIENEYDLIMIFQPGSAFAATAFLNGQVSRYRGETTTHVSTHIHELGHNFNLQHSNAAEEECKCTQRSVAPAAPFALHAFRPFVYNVFCGLNISKLHRLTLELVPLSLIDADTTGAMG
jgi:hypothetical protein